MGKLGFSRLQFYCRLARVKRRQFKERWELFKTHLLVNRLIFGPGFSRPLHPALPSPSDDLTVFDVHSDADDSVVELSSGEAVAAGEPRLEECAFGLPTLS